MIHDSENNPEQYLQPNREILDFLKAYKHYIVIGHSEPDGDCLGSQIGIGMFLQSRGAVVTLFSPGPFSRPETADLAPLFSTEWPEAASDTAVLIMDCSTPDRIGPFSEKLDLFPVGVIDHHASGSHFGKARWIEPSAASVTQMVLSIILNENELPSRENAEQLFFGLATDTGFFRHLDAGGAAALEAAAALVKAGASPKAAFARMYGNRPFNSRILLGRLLGRCRQLAEGRLIYTWETLEDSGELGKEARDSDALYQLILGTKGCVAAAVIREEAPGELSAGLRSMYGLDVGKIAAGFGGGGHAKASGFSYKGSREELERLLLPQLENELK